MVTAGVIAYEDLDKVMTEVQNEFKSISREKLDREENNAVSTLIFTLLGILTDIFGYLPPEEQSEILVKCGTWFDIGVLFGRSPKRLVQILDRVNPRMEDREVPEWYITMVKSMIKEEGD